MQGGGPDTFVDFHDRFYGIFLETLNKIPEPPEIGNTLPGGSGILAFILVLLRQGWYVLKIPSKLKHDSKKTEESWKTERKKEKIGERKKSKRQIGED